MTLLSVSEDVLATTLAALPGMWGKLQYISELRDDGGAYEHWGLTRLHGEAPVQRALGEAHRDIFLHILRTPLARLLEDACLSAADREQEAASYLQELSAVSRALLPADPGGGSEPHFNSVLKALSRLAQARSSATHRAA